MGTASLPVRAATIYLSEAVAIDRHLTPPCGVNVAACSVGTCLPRRRHTAIIGAAPATTQFCLFGRLKLWCRRATQANVVLGLQSAADELVGQALQQGNAPTSGEVLCRIFSPKSTRKYAGNRSRSCGSAMAIMSWRQPSW